MFTYGWKFNMLNEAGQVKKQITAAFIIFI